MEEWRQSKDMKNYEVSNEGRVRNSETKRIVNPTVNSHGYEVVTLYDNGIKHTKRVHRLIASNFFNEDLNEYDVKHKDRNKLNNRVDNLRLKKRYGSRNKKRIRVVETGEVYDSITACSKDLGISISVISKMINGSCFGSKTGYHFEVVD